jgi:hypothetical protein
MAEHLVGSASRGSVVVEADKRLRRTWPNDRAIGPTDAGEATPSGESNPEFAG